MLRGNDLFKDGTKLKIHSDITPPLTSVQSTGLKYHVTLSQENGLSSEWQTETCFLKFPFVENDLSHSSHLNSVIFKCTDFS